MKVTADAGIADLVAKNNADALPLQQRLLWEKQWLDQNRTSFKVIKNNAGDNSAHFTEMQYRQESTTKRTDLTSMENDKNLPRYLPDGEAAFDVANWQRDISASEMIADVPRDFAGAETPASLNQQPKSASSPALSAEIEEQYRRYEFRQSAMWREHQNVSVSMRLPKELQENREILQVMQQWLTDAGLTLRSLVINGISRFKL
jgi:hypothetical protein